MKKWVGTKNLRISHILRTLLNTFSIFGFGFFRRSFDHLLSVMNIFKQYKIHMKSPKFLKISKNWRNWWVRRMWGFLTFFVAFLIFYYFWIWIFSEIIWLPPKSNEPIETISKPYEVHKSFKKFKEVKKWEGTKNVSILHICRTLPNFLVFLDLDFFGDHLTTF